VIRSVGVQVESARPRFTKRLTLACAMFVLKFTHDCTRIDNLKYVIQLIHIECVTSRSQCERSLRRKFHVAMLTGWWLWLRFS
jgi:hypothetical protein